MKKYKEDLLKQLLMDCLMDKKYGDYTAPEGVVKAVKDMVLEHYGYNNIQWLGVLIRGKWRRFIKKWGNE